MQKNKTASQIKTDWCLLTKNSIAIFRTYLKLIASTFLCKYKKLVFQTSFRSCLFLVRCRRFFLLTKYWFMQAGVKRFFRCARWLTSLVHFPVHFLATKNILCIVSWIASVEQREILILEYFIIWDNQLESDNCEYNYKKLKIVKIRKTRKIVKSKSKEIKPPFIISYNTLYT